MLRSMTGFSRESESFEWGTLTIEISSVNHRYQELSIRLPRELSSFEPLVGAMLRAGLGRGKIRFVGEIGWAPHFKALHIDGAVLKNYFAQLSSLSKELKIGQAPNLSSLLSLPGVLDSPSVLSAVEGQVGEALEALVKKGASRIQEMRQKEGNMLLKAMEEYLVSFETLVDSIESYWEKKKGELFEQYRKKVALLLEGQTTEGDQTRVAQELALLGDKWDISEEFVRSRSHSAQFRAILEGKTSEGRKLDFLIQEMNREINTMGSKITDAELRWMIVEAKTLLEKIREQAQNVE